jgi:hypothetical protein
VVCASPTGTPAVELTSTGMGAVAHAVDALRLLTALIGQERS